MTLHLLSTLLQYFHWDCLLHRNYGLCPATKVLCPESHCHSALTSAYCVVSDVPVLSQWFGVPPHVVLFWPILNRISAATLLTCDPAVGLGAGFHLVLQILSLVILFSSFSCGRSIQPLQTGVDHMSWFHAVSRRQCRVPAGHVA